MSNDPHDPHNISADDFRKFAGIPQDIQRDLREEKADLATADIFRHIEKVLRGDATGSAKNNGYEVAVSCCEALEKKGYSKSLTEALRTYFTKMQDATEAQSAASKALQKLSSERWDKNEVY